MHTHKNVTVICYKTRRRAQSLPDIRDERQLQACLLQDDVHETDHAQHDIVLADILRLESDVEESGGRTCTECNPPPGLNMLILMLILFPALLVLVLMLVLVLSC